MLVFFTRMEGGILLNGGMYLFKEKEGAAVAYEGTIEEISFYNQYSFPNISKYHHKHDELNNIYGCEILVDNLTLKAPDSGDMSIGDRVLVVYLPNSKYILTINKLQELAN